MCVSSTKCIEQGTGCKEASIVDVVVRQLVSGLVRKQDLPMPTPSAALVASWRVEL